MTPVYNFLETETGQIVGLGTQAEFDYWSAAGTMDGCSLGERIGFEHPREDEKRRAIWARQAA